MLKNAYLLEKIGADTAEIEQHFAEILPIGRRQNIGDRRSAQQPRRVSCLSPLTLSSDARFADRMLTEKRAVSYESGTLTQTTQGEGTSERWPQTLDGSFSAVSRPIFASKY